MPENPEQDRQNADEYFSDHLNVRHSDGRSEKISLPGEEGGTVRIGRELDNDVVLTDARASRYHATIRRTEDGLVIKDLNSANGTQLGSTRLEPDTWEKMQPGQMVQMGETRLAWEKAASSQSTVMMSVPKKQEDTAVSPTPPPDSERPTTSMVPWAIGLGAVLLLLILAGLIFAFAGGFGGETATPTIIAGQTITGEQTPSALEQQTVSGAPTNTPTPSGPQLAIPAAEITSVEIRPFMLQALLSKDKVALRIDVRVQNLGNAPFKLSTGNFVVRTLDTGEVFPETGGSISEDGLRRLGAANRFNDLTLSAGGSVMESLIFDLNPESYDLEMVFQPPNVDYPPVILGLGTIHAGQELSRILGTPVAEETAIAAATPTTQPTPTPTRPAVIPAPQVVPRSALVGTIAYPVFNGTSYNLYFGNVDGSGSRVFQTGASQPAFNADGSRIAFHSWSGNRRGLVTMDTSGANGVLVTNFIEDQLPTWAANNEDIIFLTRRSGGRQSQLLRANASTELDAGITIGEGEYPTIGANGQLTFKGWGATAYGLRLASESLADIETLTNVDEDTAPALSPDGSKIAFMSRREGQWDIYIVNADGSNLQRLTTDEADDGLPAWSPDGNAVAFVSKRGGPWAIWAMTPDGAGKRQLFTMEGTPDGFVGTDTFASRGWAEERISWTSATFPVE